MLQALRAPSRSLAVDEDLLTEPVVQHSSKACIQEQDFQGLQRRMSRSVLDDMVTRYTKKANSYHER